MSNIEQQARDEFVKWAEARGEITLTCEQAFKMNGDHRYISPTTSGMWSAWQAAWNHRALSVPDNAEVVCSCPCGDGSLRWPCAQHPPVDANVAAVQRKLGERAAVGLRKYGVTTERGDLTLLDWLRHLQEELMDSAVYIEAAIANPTPVARVIVPNARSGSGSGRPRRRASRWPSTARTGSCRWSYISMS